MMLVKKYTLIIEKVFDALIAKECHDNGLEYFPGMEDKIKGLSFFEKFNITTKISDEPDGYEMGWDGEGVAYEMGYGFNISNIENIECSVWISSNLLGYFDVDEDGNINESYETMDGTNGTSWEINGV